MRTTTHHPTLQPNTTNPTNHTHTTPPCIPPQQAALLNRWADLPLEERTAARNYVATLLLAAAPDRYPTFVRAQVLQVGFVLFGGAGVCVCFGLGWVVGVGWVDTV